MAIAPCHASAGVVAARRFVLRNRRGMRVTISAHGAAPVSWLAPDRYGRLAEVLVARAGEGTQWQGTTDEGGVSLRWRGTGECVLAQVDYRLGDDGSLAVAYEAVEAVEPVFVPRAPWFNLNGGAGDVGDHMVNIHANYHLEGGALARVGGTALDLRRAAAIGARLAWQDPRLASGYFDHCYGLDGAGVLRHVAQACDPASGRRLDISTTGAMLRFATTEGLDGLCLEALMRPGRVQRHLTVYRLSV